MFRKHVEFKQPGLDKQSFAMPFHGGMIWFEHLDALGGDDRIAQQKLEGDIPSMARPSAPALIAVVLNETRVTEALCGLLANAFVQQVKHAKKVVFIGMSMGEKSAMKRALKSHVTTFAYAFISDLEKAKEWLVQ